MTASETQSASMASVLPAVATTVLTDSDEARGASTTKCNLKVMSMEEFNKMTESLVDMARVNLLDTVEAFSTSPDCISVRWRPNAKLAPHIAAYKVRYSEVSDAQQQQQLQQQQQQLTSSTAFSSSLSSSTLIQTTPFTSYTEQEYVSEFLSSNSREYSIARLSPATRYTVCVSAYPSSIEYWAKFGDNMKKCVDLETRPPPDVIAWLVLGMMGLLLVMVLILAAVVVHRRRMQARQNRSLRLAASPADYDTPVVLVAAGPPTTSTLTKQMPPAFSSGAGSTSNEQQLLQKQKQQRSPPVASTTTTTATTTGQPPPAYSTTPRSHQVVNNNHNSYVGTTAPDSKPLILAPLANDEDEAITSIHNSESVRQPILLAAVSRAKQSRTAPPLAHFTSKSCVTQHQPTQQQSECLPPDSNHNCNHNSYSHNGSHHRHHLHSSSSNGSHSATPSCPNVTLLPSHNDSSASDDLPSPSLYRTASGAGRSSGHYQHLLYNSQNKHHHHYQLHPSTQNNSTPKAGSQPQQLNNVLGDVDSSTSTSGFFGEELTSLLNNNASATINNSCSIDSDMTSTSNSQQALPDIVSAKTVCDATFVLTPQQDDTISSSSLLPLSTSKANRQATLRKQGCIDALATPPPPPPYDGIAAFYSSKLSNGHGHMHNNNNHDDIDIDIQADTDGLICVI